jgi:hypothetical protein
VEACFDSAMCVPLLHPCDWEGAEEGEPEPDAPNGIDHLCPFQWRKGDIERDECKQEEGPKQQSGQQRPPAKAPRPKRPVNAGSCEPPEWHAKNRKGVGAPDQIVPMERGPCDPMASSGFGDGELNEVCGEIDRLDGAGGTGCGRRQGKLKDVIVRNCESNVMGVEEGIVAVPCGALEVHVGHRCENSDDDVRDQRDEDRQRSRKGNALGIHASQSNREWRLGFGKNSVTKVVCLIAFSRPANTERSYGTPVNQSSR